MIKKSIAQQHNREMNISCGSAVAVAQFTCWLVRPHLIWYCTGWRLALILFLLLFLFLFLFFPSKQQTITRLFICDVFARSIMWNWKITTMDEKCLFQLPNRIIKQCSDRNDVWHVRNYSAPYPSLTCYLSLSLGDVLLTSVSFDWTRFSNLESSLVNSGEIIKHRFIFDWQHDSLRHKQQLQA